MRCPFVFETADSYLVRAATAGNFLLLEKAGNCTLSDGFKDFVHVGADFVGMQASDQDGNPTLLLQLDKNNNLVTIEAGDQGKFIVGGDGTGAWVAATSLSFGAGGMVPSEHITTIEAMANVLVKLGTLVGVPWTELNVAGAIAAAGVAPITLATLGVIQTALSKKTQNTTGLLPSVGCPGILGG